MKKIIFILLYVNIIYAVENKYTFDGDFTYHQVLNALALKTKRSVLGNQEGLELKRKWNIIDKPFSIAVEHVRLNMRSDGYKLDVNEKYLLMDKIDTTKEEKIYEIFQPNGKKWIVTKDRQQYLNALIDDKIQYEIDSIENENKQKRIADSLKILEEEKKIYKCKLRIIGFTINNNQREGVNISEIITAKISRNVTQLGIDIDIIAGKHDVKLNFDREIEFYKKGRAEEKMIFGSEIRREDIQISDNNVIRTSFESIYDGLSLKIEPDNYKLRYRIESNEILINGIPDSIIYGSAVIEQIGKKRSFFIFRNRQKIKSEFYLIAKMEVNEVIRNKK